MQRFATKQGWRYPPGASVTSGGVNFSVFSRHASGMELLLYERRDSPEPFQTITLDPDVNRTFFFWHIFVEDLPIGVHYTWRADGPDDTFRLGLRFDKNVELLDPWARSVTTSFWDRRRTSPETGKSMRAAVVDDSYDWEGDRRLEHPLENCIIYEMHVGGFTRHPSAQVANPGTFSAIIEKIPYLKELGITDVELMPVMAFDEQDVPLAAHELGLKNYWGYSPHSLFCPHPGFCASPEAGAGMREFRDMVKALHRAGIGVILDVVFNHTAEAGEDGPTINFKGLGNDTAYHLDPSDRRVYRDYTGCGNTLNCNHPLMAAFIVGCLEFWVRDMHVDGFRFDLASVLARGEDGSPLPHAPVLWSIEFSDDLIHTKIIAEAWDAAGLYQVGAFPGFRWAEWNGRYRDVVRRFIRGEKGFAGEVATRLAGSSDLYQPQGRLPINSINFVTCHDGFTLNDLVSYNQKHNNANGDGNRDGTNENLSWNCGFEGRTRDRDVLLLRRRQAKNFVAILLLSQGVPMILSGDEVLRTQRGNNNCYCQDNELSWFDWTLTEENREMLRFVRLMIAFRKRHPCLMRNRFLTGRVRQGDRLPDVSWHGIRLNEPPWNDPDSQFLAFTMAATAPMEEDIHVMMNMSEHSAAAELPYLPGRKWFRAADTSRSSPWDAVDPSEQPAIKETPYTVPPHSVVIFESRPETR